MKTPSSADFSFDNRGSGHWIQSLEQGTEAERERAAAVWGVFGDLLRSGLPKLLAALKDSSPAVRKQAAASLGMIGEQALAAVPLMRTALKESAWRDTDERVREAAVNAVVRVGPHSRSPVPALIEGLQDELSEVRLNAALALGEMGKDAKPAVSALIRSHLYDKEAAVRVEAAVALWKIDRQDRLAVPALTKALADENELVCWAAADCLGDIGAAAKDALPALRLALNRTFKTALIRKGVELALERIESATP